jgi:AAA+ ATPase superfamily predicted ATPase
MASDALMSMREAADWLGWEGRDRGRRLKRTLLAIEKQKKREIMVRRGPEGDGRRYLVTRGAIARWAPQLRPSKVDELEKNFATYIRTLNETIDDKIESFVSEHIDPQIEELWQRQERTAQIVDELAQHVVGPKRPGPANTVQAKRTG